MAQSNNVLVRTSGRGENACAQGEVHVSTFNFIRGSEGGELRVNFDGRRWKTDRDGVIAGDPMFLREIRAVLKGMGLPAAGVNYGPKEAQGRNYVSMTGTVTFANAWERNPA